MPINTEALENGVQKFYRWPALPILPAIVVLDQDTADSETRPFSLGRNVQIVVEGTTVFLKINHVRTQYDISTQQGKDAAYTALTELMWDITLHTPEDPSAERWLSKDAQGMIGAQLSRFIRGIKVVYR